VNIKGLLPEEAARIERENAMLSPSLRIRVVCSKGTYIRALARDIGEALGTGAYLQALRRTRIGDYSVENCLRIENFEQWVDEQSLERPMSSEP